MPASSRILDAPPVVRPSWAHEAGHHARLPPIQTQDTSLAELPPSALPSTPPPPRPHQQQRNHHHHRAKTTSPDRTRTPTERPSTSASSCLPNATTTFTSPQLTGAEGNEDPDETSSHQTVEGDMVFPVEEDMDLGDGMLAGSVGGAGGGGQAGSTTSKMVSLHVCRDCQQNLLHTFDHCLSRASGGGGGSATKPTPAKDIIPALTSIHEIDEVKDAVRLTSPPFYKLYNATDITQQPNPVFNDLGSRITKDRYVFHTTRQAHAVPHGPTLGASKTFSGNIYKSMMTRKEKEIRELMGKLYDSIVSEALEKKNVERLKLALEKSVKYYSHAEEWQAHESARLQRDVKYLKAEMSSLMAFLIHSEEEKRVLRSQMEEMKKVMKTKDDELAKAFSASDEIKHKLHESYKEFLRMNETIDALKREAAQGSDDIISRNEVLQRNIDKLARDFETTSRECHAANTKIKEMEFELDEMIVQFNIAGEAKKSAEELNIKLTSELDHLTKEHKDLQARYSASVDKGIQLEGDLADALELHKITKQGLEGRVERQARELETAANVKRDLETALKSSRVEVEKLSTALKALTRTKDQLESAFKAAKDKHDRDMVRHEEKIKDLQTMRAGDERVIARLKEQKESMMLQVTDLQNNLDRETGNVSSLTFELTNLKRSSEEKVANLEEQVEILNNAKVNLANDKRQLTDKVRSLRTDLKSTTEELEAVKQSFEEHKTAAAGTESGLREELQILTTAHAKLNDEHANLQKTQALVLETNVDLVMKMEALGKKQALLEQRESLTRTEIATIQEDNDRLQKECEEAIKERGEMKIHLDSVIHKLNDLNQILHQERNESSNTIKDKTERIVQMTAELYALQEEEKRLNALSSALQDAVDRLEIELSDTKAALEAETQNKHQFEASLYEIRSKFLSEKRGRLDLERMHARLDRHAVAREMERLLAMRGRDQRLEVLSKGLRGEVGRLKDISGMLPPDLKVDIIEAPEIPEFHGTTDTHSTHGKRPADGTKEVNPVKITATSLKKHH